MKKSTKHMQFLRISLLIFAISFIFACSLGTQSYGKLSLSIEVPEYIKTEPNEQANNARFIHPNGDSLEFELYTERRVIHTQTIPLNPKSNSPQTVPISVDKVPYNVSLFAKITVYENLASVAGNSILGQNTIDIGQLRYPTQKLTLGVKPEGGVNVEYVEQDGDIILDVDLISYADTFNIEMFPKKGLYTISCNNSEHIYLYDSEGKTYPNSFLINGLEQSTRVFYHPENKASTYYAYLSEPEYLSGSEPEYLSGYKLDRDILITRYDDDRDMIVGSEGNINFGYLSPSGNSSTEIFFTIYNPYPFTLYPNYSSKGESLEDFTFNDFPEVLLPGQSKKFTVIFETKEASVSVPITISANELEGLFLFFTGTSSGF